MAYKVRIDLFWQMYQVNQRGQDPTGGPDPSHHYQRADGGDADADAEGERDYSVPLG